MTNEEKQQKAIDVSVELTKKIISIHREGVLLFASPKDVGKWASIAAREIVIGCTKETPIEQTD